jgi:uncharacterized protein YbaR (Trm112 family)
MKTRHIPFMAGLALGTGLALVRRARRIQVERLAWQKQRRAALDVFACPECRGALKVVSLQAESGYLCPACQKVYPIVAGIPHFIEPQVLTGLNQRFSQLYDWFSWGYRAFSKVAFAYIGLTEEQARREVTDRLDPGGGRLLEVSIDGVFHLGGINFFSDQKKAIEELIRVAKPGTRLLICDENEKGAQAYERFLPSFKQMAGKQRPAVLPPVDLLPPRMQEVRLFEVWNGWMYCIEFRKPSSAEAV